MKKVKVLAILVFVSLQIIAQNPAESFISLKLGPSSTSALLNQGYLIEGSGFTYNVSYKQNLWNNNFRLCPTLEYGIYNSKRPSIHGSFNAITTSLLLEWDAYKYKSFVLTLQTGAGLESKAVRFFDDQIADSDFGMLMYGASIAYAPENSRISYFIQPLHGYIGTNKQSEDSYKNSILFGLNIALGSNEVEEVIEEQ